jgi:hypothetical protein
MSRNREKHGEAKKKNPRAIKDRQSFSDNVVKPKPTNSFEKGRKLKRGRSGSAITATPMHGGRFRATVLPKIDTQMSYASSSLELALSRASFRTAKGYQPSPLSPTRIYL